MEKDEPKKKPTRAYRTRESGRTNENIPFCSNCGAHCFIGVVTCDCPGQPWSRTARDKERARMVKPYKMPTRPWEVIQETLIARDYTPGSYAEKVGCSREYMEDLASGKKRISKVAAKILYKHLKSRGGLALWLRLQANWDKRPGGANDLIERKLEYVYQV